MSPIGLAVVLILVLGGAGAAATWYFDGSAAVEDDGSVQALAANALGTAREAAVFFRDSASRDIENLAELLRESAPEEEEETEDQDEAVGLKLTGSAPAAPVTMGPTVDEWMTGAPGPSLARHVSPLASAEVPIEPPLFMVFDNSHPDVSPPGAEAIRMRNRASIGLRIADEATPETGLVEVVVGAAGEVETAKLISSPQNVHESMFLSAVKAWKFEPAVKDGQAVRYRQRMHVAVDP